ncbi:MAG: hypothetical protein M3076_19445 [Actinomycetota bacterium]|nr:hypothetical protein [Actinomycetota bacterium]
MGSMLKFDSERRELVRERRNARIQRKHQRRQALQRKRTEITGLEVQGAAYSLDPANPQGASEPVPRAQRVEPSRPEPRERAASHEVDQPTRNTPEASAEGGVV